MPDIPLSSLASFPWVDQLGYPDHMEAQDARNAARRTTSRAVLPPDGRKEGTTTKAIEALNRLHPISIVKGAYDLAQNTAHNLDHYQENELSGNTGLYDNGAALALMMTLGRLGRGTQVGTSKPPLPHTETRSRPIDRTAQTEAMRAEAEARPVLELTRDMEAPPKPSIGAVERKRIPVSEIPPNILAMIRRGEPEPLQALTNANPSLSAPIRKVGPTEGNVTTLYQGAVPSWLSTLLAGRREPPRMVDRQARPSWEMEPTPVPSARLEEAYMRGELPRHSPPAEILPPSRDMLPMAEVNPRAPEFLNQRQPEQPQLPAPSPMDARPPLAPPRVEAQGHHPPMRDLIAAEEIAKRMRELREDTPLMSLLRRVPQ